MGHALVARNVSAVVAMRQRITDESAILFSGTFYDALVDGLPVDATYAAVGLHASAEAAIKREREAPEGNELVETATPFYLPNLDALPVLRARHHRRTERTVLVLVAAGSPPAGAWREARSIDGDREVRILRGDELTADPLKKAAARASTIHIIAHGEPATRKQAGLVVLGSTGRPFDLDATVAASLQMNAEDVVLSACAAQDGPVTRGDDRMHVLYRAFLEGGARAAVAAQGSIDSRSATRLMIAYEHYRLNADPAASLAHAQRDMLHARPPLAEPRTGTGEATASAIAPGEQDPDSRDLRHPYYWAAYAVHGDPGPPP